MLKHPSRHRLLFPLIFLLLMGSSFLSVSAEEPPSGPLELRFQWTAPLRYQVESRARMSFEEEPALDQDYASRMSIEYRPLSRPQRELIPRWPLEIALPESRAPEERDASRSTPLLARILDFSAAFDAPRGAAVRNRTHQLLKNAAFSFQIDSRGVIEDIRIHPPTNPLARANLEEMIRLIAAAHPILPAEPLEPGDSWSEQISLSVDTGPLQKTQDAELTYTLQEWEPCGAFHCARIDVVQKVRGSAHYRDERLESRTESTGRGEGFFLLEIHSGRVLRSRWTLSTSGESRAGEELQESPPSRYHIEIETSMELSEEPDIETSSPPRAPNEDPR